MSYTEIVKKEGLLQKIKNFNYLLKNVVKKGYDNELDTLFDINILIEKFKMNWESIELFKDGYEEESDQEDDNDVDDNYVDDNDDNENDGNESDDITCEYNCDEDYSSNDEIDGYSVNSNDNFIFNGTNKFTQDKMISEFLKNKEIDIIKVNLYHNNNLMKDRLESYLRDILVF